MNHLNTQHDHLMINQTHSVPMHSNHIEMQQHITTNFWNLSNTIELIFILCFVGLFILKRKKRLGNPFIITITSILFFVSMHPITDSIARHSVWLHCLQSSFIHHLIPLALLITLPPQNTSYIKQPLSNITYLLVFSIVVFNIMSLMWILPALHLQLMQDALLYSMMKWAMVFTGILLCWSMQAFNHYKKIAGLNYKQFVVIMLFPQAIIGILLVFLPPLYVMPSALMQHAHVSEFIHILPKFSEQQDQFLGGIILISASLLFLIVDIKRRRTSLQFTSSLRKEAT